MDSLFVANKPANLGSNHFLSRIKRRYNVKKAGFSGTLDPFAKGVLIIAFGKYTQLFQFLKKSPKTYRATLWLGAESETLDIEKVTTVQTLSPIATEVLQTIFTTLHGEITYLPPKYSAKKINGKRAYELAREGQEVLLRYITSTIYDIKLIHYRHPFITFEITISEGGYIRSIAQIISDKLQMKGTLSALERLNEGDFVYQKEQMLDPLKYLNLKENFYLQDLSDIALGRKLALKDLKIKEAGKYFIKLDKMFSILEIKDDKVSYLLNGVKYADIRS
ncbi:MAG: tRNA pseudouridine(55) synthase TruB [Epsilonproteobacteria bacterium]|nr:tRNA pseudouridine(55) synthase TruB [Campylobacterota bacterium]